MNRRELLLGFVGAVFSPVEIFEPEVGTTWFNSAEGVLDYPFTAARGLVAYGFDFRQFLDKSDRFEVITVRLPPVSDDMAFVVAGRRMSIGS